MFFKIKELGKRLAERLREVLESLPLSGPWAPRPIPVPARPPTQTRRLLQIRGRVLASLAFALVVAGTTQPGQSDDSVETPCAVCRAWDAAMKGVPQDQVSLEAHTVENGVVLRATSLIPKVRAAIWSMTAQRQQLLESLHQGQDVPLCPSCRANLRAFDELRIDSVRLPDGVVLLYTSNQPEVVRRLQEMVTGVGSFL
jgi:hypothetical protein